MLSVASTSIQTRVTSLPGTHLTWANIAKLLTSLQSCSKARPQFLAMELGRQLRGHPGGSHGYVTSLNEWHRQQLTGKGHTACLWQGSKLLVFGGENEHREYLSDVVILDLQTHHWTQPEVRGPIPKGRARHAAVVHDDKLYIVGGLAGSSETYTLDEICYLDLKTWTWSRSWSFVGRYDHSVYIWGGRIWVFGGLGADMERTGELWWLDFKSSPAFRTVPVQGTESGAHDRTGPNSRAQLGQYVQPMNNATGSSGYAANSSSVQVRTSLNPKPVAPGAISAMRFMSGPNVPSQAYGTHFHAYSSGSLLDFATPVDTMHPSECNLSALELGTLQWQKLAEGLEIFDPGYRWQYCSMNEDGTKAWLIGSVSDPPENNAGMAEEYLSDVLLLDLRRFGLLGNDMSAEPNVELGRLPASDTHPTSNLSSLGADLASKFDLGTDSGADFTITGEKDDYDDDDPYISSSSQQLETSTSLPIHVHKLILQARWPHFNRVYNSQMAEFQTKKMHIPEPYSVVRAFLYYLYTDSIAKHPQYCDSLDDVAGLLVMANVYDMPRLRLLCLHRLSRELDVDHAAIIWERAGVAQEEWLRRRAANYCLTHWGRVVRSEGFRRLSRQSMMEMCEVIDIEGRVVGGEELEMVGGLGGGKFGVGGLGRAPSRRRSSSHGMNTTDDGDEGDEDEGMDVN